MNILKSTTVKYLLDLLIRELVSSKNDVAIATMLDLTQNIFHKDASQ